MIGRTPHQLPTPMVARLLPLLASDHDGEVVATARAIGRALKGAGCDFHDLARALALPDADSQPARAARATCVYEDWTPTTWLDLARWVLEHGTNRLAKHERQFVVDVRYRFAAGAHPTERQARWLHDLRAKLTGGARGR